MSAPAPVAGKAPVCPMCGQAGAAGDAVCARCGWDAVAMRRRCRECRGRVAIESGFRAGPVLGVLGVLALSVSLFSGFLGSLAILLTLGGLAGFIRARCLVHRCGSCGRQVPDVLLSTGEREERRGRTATLYMGSAGTLAAGIVAGCVWLLVAGWLGGGFRSADIGSLEAKGAESVPALVRALRDPVVRWDAVGALGRIGAPSVEPLRAKLRDPEWEVRRSAAAALGQVGPHAAPAVRDLIALLKDPEGMVRQSAVQALGKIGPEAAPAVDSIVGATADPDDLVVLNAVVALGDIGPAAAAGLPRLREIAEIPNSNLAWQAREVIKKIEGAEER